MKHKTIIQFVFGIIFLIIIFLFYYKYFLSNKEKVIMRISSDDFKSLESKNNSIRDISYQVTDDYGNKYFIFSKYGELNTDGSNIILMEDVEARIEVFEKDTIYISSLSAKYNVINYETNFNKNVQLKYLDHKIFSENIDLSFQKNFAWVYKDVIYKSPNYELFADKIEIDLITKNSKIFTNGDKKVKIIKK
jgi:hypothetical protein